MISIRRYMQNDQRNSDMLLQLTQLLIEGVETHSLKGAPGELERFREGTRRILVALESQAPPAELLALGAGAVDALKQHNLHVMEYLQRPVVELQAKVRLLTDAITSVSSSSSENIRRLQEIKGKLLSTLDVRDVRSMKDRLSQCLDGVLVEAQRQRSELDRAAEHLNRPSQPLYAPGYAGEAPIADTATGLPDRAQAEEAIAQCCQDQAAAFVAIMVINQVQTMSRNLGSQSGDLILRRFATFVRKELPVIDQVFRWSGPTVVALLRRKTVLDVRSVIEPLLLQRLTVKIANPGVQVPISARWTVLPLMASPRLLFHKMDSFAGIGASENPDFAES